MTTAVPYIERLDHRAPVAAAFSEAGHVVLVTGEAGVGKSTLVEAERAGAVTAVLKGSCLPLAGRPLPLAALEQLFEARGGWPGIDEDSTAPQTPEQRLRTVRTWADSLVPVGAEGPTTVVAEDLHWADETTCDVLVYLASTAARRRLSLILTLRSDEAPLTARARQACAELARLPGASRVDLPTLDREGCRDLAAALGGAQPGDDELEDLYHRSQGNPYLLGELVKDRAVRDVPDLLLARFSRLGDDAAGLVRLAAVCGLWVSDEQLHAGSDLREERYAAAVREAVDAGVLLAEGSGYAFRHSLMAEAVLAQLLPVERRFLHARAARALTERPVAPGDAVTAAAAALHWDGAGVPDHAAEWWLRAARAARRLNAFAGSWNHYCRVLELRVHLPPAEAGPDLVLEAAAAARL
ncbi:MAG: AAA family ATPase, partial [Myxococcales bacterium]